LVSLGRLLNVKGVNIPLLCLNQAGNNSVNWLLVMVIAFFQLVNKQVTNANLLGCLPFLAMGNQTIFSLSVNVSPLNILLKLFSLESYKIKPFQGLLIAHKACYLGIVEVGLKSLSITF